MRYSFQIIILLLLIGQSSLAQKPETKVPKNIMEAVTVLEVTCSSTTKSKIKKADNEDLIDIYYESEDKHKPLSEWMYDDKEDNLLVAYLNGKGIESDKNQQAVVLSAFKSHLINGKTNEEQVIKYYREIEDEWRREMQIRYAADSLDGIYVPKDLKDAYEQIDVSLPDSIKTRIKKMSEDDFISNSHFGSGLSIRNGWQLWRGSRLSKYFNDMGIYHPDDMSGIILTSYYRYLTGKEIELEKQVAYYKKYWIVMKQPRKDDYPEGGKENIELHRVQFYETNNEPAAVRIQTNSKTSKIWIYNYYLGWKQITDKDLKRIDEAESEEIEGILEKIYKE